jgi:hypothetical protein
VTESKRGIKPTGAVRCLLGCAHTRTFQDYSSAAISKPTHMVGTERQAIPAKSKNTTLVFHPLSSTPPGRTAKTLLRRAGIACVLAVSA